MARSIWITRKNSPRSSKIGPTLVSSSLGHDKFIMLSVRLLKSLGVCRLSLAFSKTFVMAPNRPSQRCKASFGISAKLPTSS